MTLTMSRPIEPSLVGEPCGQHGNYTFYKAFKYQLKANSKIKVLMLGEFFFLRISPHDDPCIGELQLLWDDRTSDQLYFLPEQTPDGRLSSHGEVSLFFRSINYRVVTKGVTSITNIPSGTYFPNA